MKVAITGATGFVGSRLVQRLQDKGHQPLILTRNQTAAARAFPNLEIVAYTPTVSGSWQNAIPKVGEAIAGCDAVVNLAGVPIAEHRWTPQRKEEILNSRKLVTQKIVEAITQANPKPAVLINTSAIGYYGTSETISFDETSASGNDFLAQVCQAWEGEAMKVKDAGVRLVILRFGIVLGNGGALSKMIPPFQMFAGGPIGTGKQWFSWIHIDDLVNLIVTALTQSNMEGVFNATAPNPVRMSEFCHTLGDVLHRPSWLPVPNFAIEALLGEGANVVLEGQEVLPKRTLSYGFEYQYPTAKEALKEILTNV